MDRNRHTLKKESGQAIIEFIFGLMLVISFFFFYVKLAAVFAVGNYIHYATFMSARAYSSSSSSVGQQQSNAEDVLRKMLGGRWRSLIKPKGGGSIPGGTVGAGPYYDENPLLDYWNQGVTFSFESVMSIYPWNRGGEALTLKLVSESWMGREEPSDECKAKKNIIKATSKAVKIFWENGDEGC